MEQIRIKVTYKFFVWLVYITIATWLTFISVAEKYEGNGYIAGLVFCYIIMGYPLSIFLIKVRQE